MKFVYMDHAATTPVRAEVAEAMRPFLGEEAFGNPSSIHAAGRAARKALEDARERVAAVLGAQPREIVFTSGGTESDNLAILGAVEANATRGKRVVASAVEHPAVLRACEHLRDRDHPVVFLPVDAECRVSVDALREQLSDDTVLVSIMAANNEVGTIQPVAALAEAAHRRKALFHTDAVAAAGKIPIDVRAWGVDLLSLSAHKFHGPKGTGVLFVRRGTRLAPRTFGGEQEFSRRSGTQNVAGAVGLCVALELAAAEREAESARLAALRRKLEEGLDHRVPGLRVVTPPSETLPGTLMVCFDGVEGEGVILHLDQSGIGVASGSACTSTHREPSHVLSAMHLPAALAASATRFSLGRSNTEEEIDWAVEATARAVERLRAVAGKGSHRRSAVSGQHE